MSCRSEIIKAKLDVALWREQRPPKVSSEQQFVVSGTVSNVGAGPSKKVERVSGDSLPEGLVHCVERIVDGVPNLGRGAHCRPRFGSAVSGSGRQRSRKVPYRRAATVLQGLLTERVSHATLRRHTLKVGARLQQRVIEPSEYDWPEPRREPVPAAKSLSVAIDGTYIRADGAMWPREYHVVAGRMERRGESGGYFAWVPQHRLCFTKDFMKAALEDNGWTPKSQVRVLADGADGLSNLVGAAAGKPMVSMRTLFANVNTLFANEPHKKMLAGQ
jgi:hypothetical protein